jgi:hypothetical protein
MRLWALECGDIPADTPSVGAIRGVARTGLQDPPAACGWTIDCNIRLPISIVIGGDQNVLLNLAVRGVLDESDGQ